MVGCVHCLVDAAFSCSLPTVLIWWATKDIIVIHSMEATQMLMLFLIYAGARSTGDKAWFVAVS